MAGIISFYTFMIQNYIKSDPPAGDLARDMKDDSGFPKRSISYEKIRDYLERNAACIECIEAFDDCWNEYELWKEQCES